MQNNSIHIITSKPKIIGKYRLLSSCNNNIQITKYKLEHNISKIICEQIYSHSEMDLDPPNTLFKNINKKYINETHEELELYTKKPKNKKN